MEWENSMLQLILDIYVCAYKLLSDHPKHKETTTKNKHQIMSVHTKWNCLIPVLSNWSSISCFRSENVSCKRRLHRSGK